MEWNGHCYLGWILKKHGTLAFIIEEDDPQKDLFEGTVVPGHPEEHNTLHSELLGCFGIVVMVEAICKQHDIREGVIVLVCDNIKALRWAVDMNFFVSP